MFKDDFRSLHGLLSEGHQLATKNILYFGFFLVMLAMLIFTFPAIIGTLFAIFIFLIGLVALIMGHYFRKVKAEKNYSLDLFYIEFNSIKHRHNKPRYYTFHKIRFIRC